MQLHAPHTASTDGALICWMVPSASPHVSQRLRHMLRDAWIGRLHRLWMGFTQRRRGGWLHGAALSCTDVCIGRLRCATQQDSIRGRFQRGMPACPHGVGFEVGHVAAAHTSHTCCNDSHSAQRLSGVWGYRGLEIKRVVRRMLPTQCLLQRELYPTPWVLVGAPHVP